MGIANFNDWASNVKTTLVLTPYMDNRGNSRASTCPISWKGCVY